jgi:membrane protease YdiL (CAAX protease family)
LLVALVGQAGLAFVFPLFLRADPTLMAGLVNLVVLSSVAAFGFLKSQRPRFGPVGAGWGFWVALALTAWGGTVVLGELANLTMGFLPLSPALARVFNHLANGNTAVALFTVALVAPLTEEALFRGLLLRSFAQRWGPAPGLVLSSALFALFHLNPWQALPAFFAGLFLGWVFLRTGSLLYPMVGHALFNATPLLFSASGLVVTGYNTPLVPGFVDFQPPLWTLTGTVVLVAGLGLTKRWAPLLPAPVSDRVAP